MDTTQIPVLDKNYSAEREQTVKEYVSLVKEIMNEKPYVAHVLKRLDAHSPVSEDHSVKVGLLIYDNFKNIPMVSRDELKEMVSAAILHDVGKLTTPDSILNGKTDLKSSIDHNKELIVMMRHSLDGLDDANAYGFTRMEKIAAIAHHVACSAVDDNWENAKASKYGWTTSYNDPNVDEIMRKEIGDLQGNERVFLKMLSFCDVIEER